MKTMLRRWDSRNDIPAMDQPVRRQAKRGVVSGHEVGSADARRPENIYLSTAEAFFSSCSIHRNHGARGAETMACYKQGTVLLHAVFDYSLNLYPDGRCCIKSAFVYIRCRLAEVEIRDPIQQIQRVGSC